MSTVVDPVVAPPATQQGNHDKFAHIVDKTKVTDAYVYGSPLEALCGKLWVPSADPANYPLCPACDAEHERLTGVGFDG